MRKIWLIVLLLIVKGICSGQDAISKDYFFSLPYYGSANIKSTPDSGFITIMVLSDGLNVFKFDSTGNKSWCKKINYPMGTICDVLPWDDCFYITGYTGNDHIQLIKIDKNGDFLWRKLYCHPSPVSGAGSHQGFSLHKTSNSDLIIYGIYETPMPVVTLVKVDTAGLLKWTKQYNTTLTYNRAISIKDKSVIIANRNSIMNIDTSGSVRWSLITSTIAPTFGNGAVGLNDGIVFSTYSTDSGFVYKLDLYGNLIWKTNYLKIGSRNMVEDNGVIVCGNYKNGNKNYISLVKINNQGVVNWQNAIEADTLLVSARITRLLNGKMAIMAMYPDKFTIYYFTNPQIPSCIYSLQAPLLSSPVFTLQADNVSYSNINFYTLASTASSQEFSDNVIFRCQTSPSFLHENERIRSIVYVFPNPSSGIFTIELKRLETPKKLGVYDQLGKCVFQKEYFNQSVSVDISAHPKGIYFVKLTDDLSSIGIKIIKE